MDVILLERIGRLGQMGDVVKVKDGFARNFLLPRGKALRASADNKARFEGMKAELQTKSLEAKGEAGKLAAKVDGKTYVVIRQASETGQLFGSVSTRDIANLIQAEGAEVNRAQIALNAPIKLIGAYKVPLDLHPDVEVSVTVTVARSAAEAERIARGENVNIRRDEDEEDAAEARAKAEALFDENATAAEDDDSEADGEDSADAETPAKAAKKKKKDADED